MKFVGALGVICQFDKSQVAQSKVTFKHTHEREHLGHQKVSKSGLD